MAERASRGEDLFHPRDAMTAGGILQALDELGCPKTYSPVYPHIFLRVRKTSKGEIQDYFISAVLEDGTRLVKTFPITELDGARAFLEGKNLKEDATMKELVETGEWLFS